MKRSHLDSPFQIIPICHVQSGIGIVIIVVFVIIVVVVVVAMQPPKIDRKNKVLRFRY